MRMNDLISWHDRFSHAVLVLTVQNETTTSECFLLIKKKKEGGGGWDIGS